MPTKSPLVNVVSIDREDSETVDETMGIIVSNALVNRTGKM